MKRITILLIMSLFFTGAYAQKSIHKILKPNRFEQKISRKNVVVLDVRTPEEYKEGFIKNAENINVKDGDFRTKLESYDRNQPVYLYCRSGKRSAKATEILQEMGFKKIYDLKGGILNWRGELEQQQKETENQ